MPTRVANFFRSSSNSIDNHPSLTSLKPTVRNRSSSSRSRTRTTDTRQFSYASSIDTDSEETSPLPYSSTAPPPPPPPRAKTMASSTAEALSHHRRSLAGLLPGRSSKPELVNPSASLDWKLESPPVVFHNDAESSSGALVSGQLLLDVRDEPFEVETFRATLSLHVVHKKPFQSHCADCQNQLTTIKEWTFLTQPISLTQDIHNYPFSVLLPGHLPASIDSQLVSIAYEFKAELTAKCGPPVKLDRILTVSRALPPVENPHHSLRVFPPTNITATVNYPHVIHPIGVNTLQLRLGGMVRKVNREVRTIEFWRLKRLSWRIEETVKTVAPACDRHNNNSSSNGAQQNSSAAETSPAGRKGMARVDTRSVGGKDLTDGWKSCYNAESGGEVQLDIEFHCHAPDHGGSVLSLSAGGSTHRHGTPLCDLRARDGTEITHSLVVEMVVVQEYAPLNQPRHSTPTGLARILRMHFATVVTERAGLGVSWDNEAPPIYQDVPPSPPAYTEELDLENLERELERASSSEGGPNGHHRRRSSGAAAGPSGTNAGRRSPR